MIVEAALFAVVLVVIAGVTRILLAARQERRREPAVSDPLFFIRYPPPEVGRVAGESSATAKNLEKSA